MRRIEHLSLLVSVFVLAGCGSPEEGPSRHASTPAQNSALASSDSTEPCRGLRLPEYIKFAIPEGSYRYTFDGHDKFAGRAACRVVVTARQSPECGAEIFAVSSRGRLQSPDGSIDPDGSPAIRPVKDSFVVTGHLIKSGMTLRSSSGGSLSLPREVKFFGPALDRLEYFEHVLPVFPLSWQKLSCGDLQLVQKETVVPDPAR